MVALFAKEVNRMRRKLRLAARARGLSMSEIAVRMGNSPAAKGAVHKLLHEPSYNPRIDTLYALAHALGQPLRDFL